MSTGDMKDFKSEQQQPQQQQPQGDRAQGKPRGKGKPHHRRRSKHKQAPSDGIAGALLVDKPRGLTSFDVVERVRELLDVERVGHCGTLDPLATGLLVLLIGEATKVAQFLTDEDKAYEGQMRFGVETETDDVEGAVVKTADISKLTLADLQAAAKKQLGEIVQKPPRYSAQKRGGVRAYERARAGEVFEPEARPVIVHSLELTKMHADGVVDFTCRVGKGTYVRSLARDIGALCEVGGHVLNLRRTFSGGFDAKDSLTLDAIGALENRRSAVKSLGDAWRPRPLFRVGPEDVARLRRGQQIAVMKEAVEESRGTEATALALGQDEKPYAVGKLVWDRLTRTFVFAPERNLFT
jgi:tRNA pseudouridine55 synthase